MTHGANIQAIFSDSEEEEDKEKEKDTVPAAIARTAGGIVPSLATLTHTTTGFVNPMLTSTAYHIHQAESALASLKQIWREDARDGWKKALKHKKSGVMVHIKNGKTPIFRGEAVIHGFSPPSIFYVIGMRRLWDEQYDDGNLVENLNDTTSLTYEVCKATSSLCTSSMNRQRDMVLVEKIECTRDGAIFFACTSVESPCVPRVQGRVRVQIQLQGWILQPIRGSPLPSTRVMYVIQESVKGWVPAFAKKSFARRPLVIALVNEYLEKKANRMRAQKMRAAATSPSSSSTTPHRIQPTRKVSFISSNSISSSHHVSASSHRQEQDELTGGRDRCSSVKNVSSSSQVTTPVPEAGPSGSRVDHHPTGAIAEQQHLSRKRHSLYPPHRHLERKNEAMGLIKRLGASLDAWALTAEDHGCRMYAFVPNSGGGESSDSTLFLPSLTRIDRSLQQDLTAEQLCSVVQCFGARKIWDSQFLDGQILERFSQKDYLVEWKLANGSSTDTPAITTLRAIVSIDTDPTMGVITVAMGGIDTRDFDGWIFRPNPLNKKTVDLSWISITPPPSIPRLNALEVYVSQHGCPPYIRRVAGKVIDEAFDSKTGVYDVTFIAKHELHGRSFTKKHDDNDDDNDDDGGVVAADASSCSHHHRRGRWCTDIRIHRSRYPAGFNIILTPDAGTRVDLTPSASCLRLYTTSSKMEGKRISLRIVPSTPKHPSSPQFMLNGVSLMLLPPPPPPSPSPSPSPLVSTKLDPVDAPAPVIPPAQNVDPQPALQVVTTTTTVKTPAPTPTPKPTVPEEQQPVSSSLPPIARPQQPTATPSSCDMLPSSPGAGSMKKITRLSSDRLRHQQVLLIPEGYKLIPQHHNSNIIILSDELTFNGQQLAVVFLAMVLCYYMGKLACASAYC
ncbi:hypothetical protein BX666DRAFT_2031054 [Dichotomocladium elegans]|nr:hypothetical protein BX666DRAFT_2031054 [Dichotomocladium elegans]